MQCLTFEDVFPIASSLARKKANGVVRHCGFSPGDRDDVISELLLAFYLAFPKFDSTRASVRTFASRVMDKQLRSILRHRLAKCRRDLLQTTPLDGLSDLDSLQRHQFWLDFERAMAPCAGTLRQTAIGLCWESPLELSRSSGRSRACIYERIGRLRGAFRKAGIDRAYFSGVGVRS